MPSIVETGLHDQIIFFLHTQDIFTKNPSTFEHFRLFLNKIQLINIINHIPYVLDLAHVGLLSILKFDIGAYSRGGLNRGEVAY